MVRLGFVGAGLWMRTYHLPTAERLAAEGEVELTAIWNRTTEKAEALARQFGVGQRFEGFESFLREAEVDALVVALTKESVGPILARLMEREVPILVEKPPASDSREARELAGRARAPVMVAFNRNHTPLVEKLRGIIASDPIEFAEAHFLRRRRADDLFVTETGIHALALLEELLGEGRLRWSQRREFNGEPRRSPDWHAEVSYPSGVTGLLHFMPTAGHAVERYQFHGRDSSLYVQMKQHYARDGESYIELARVTPGGESELEALEFSREDLLHHDGYLGEYRRFCGVVEGREAPGNSLEGTARLMELAESIEAGKQPR
jgi:predicted dehydrogenase